MENFLINNLFANNQIEHINKILNDNEDKIIFDEPDLGRTRYDFDRKDLGKELVSFLNMTAQKYNKTLYLASCYYSEYNLKYGNPTLSIHTDQSPSVFTIDYQLDSNIDWPVYVEGKEFNLKNNQAVTINVNSQAHWRPKRIFAHGEYIKMIYFHFIDLSIKNPKILTKEEMVPMQQKWNHLWEFPENLNKY